MRSTFLAKFAVRALLTLSPLSPAAFARPDAPPPATDPGDSPTAPDHTPARFEPVADPASLPQSPWKRFYTTDEIGRLITFYVSLPAPAETPAPSDLLPVILYVQGSGSQSIFSRVDTPKGKRIVPSGGHGSVRDAAAGNAIVVAVEKPGVRFLEQPTHPGSAEEGSQQFREEHTLERWTLAVAAALKAALTLPRADPSRILVEGHSEGGLVACKVAADNPNVTHVATLAGGGATQLFDLIDLARRGEFCGSKPRPKDQCADWLLAQWDEVLKSPDSADLFFLGHPHRRWTTFLATSPAEQLRKSKARVFIGQGTDDHATSTAGADMLYATLRADGRDVTYSRIPGDHGFSDPAHPQVDGWQEMHNRVVHWFLESH